MLNIKNKIFILVLFFIVSIVANNYTCSDSRKIIINENHGFISDGPSFYPENVHCEWLIVAPEKSFVSFHVLSLQTECLYDYLYIFSGNSYSSGKLIGSLCGNQTNQNFTSPSEMLILLFSDANTVQQGFEAEFFVFACPENCNSRGKCQSELGVCTCDEHYSGPSCHHQTCLINQCSGHGTCTLDNEIYSCHCNEGYYGDSCNIPDVSNSSDSSNLLHWKLLTSSRFPSRTSHNMVYVDEVNKIFIFNGNDLNNISNDFYNFDISSNKWTVTPGGNPNPRYGAAADELPFGFVYYGGWTSSENLMISNELHMYNDVFLQWLQPKPTCEPSQCSNPPGLVYHTLTTIDEVTIYVIGGITERFLFNEFIYKYNIRDNVWIKIVPKNYIGMNSLRFGHTTVYDKSLNCMIVFGGFVPQTLRLSFIDDSLLMFDLTSEIWLHVKSSASGLSPIGRAFHSASFISDYNIMVVYGGTVDVKAANSNETCITDAIWLYNTCNQMWSSVSREDNNDNVLPRFSHSSVVINDQMFVSGGYNGKVLDDVRFIKFPSNDNEFQILCQNNTQEHCHFYPQCNWCDDKNVCSRNITGCSTVIKQNATNCKQKFCSLFKYCSECQTESDTSCFWCTKTKRCLAISESTQCPNNTKINCDTSINGMLVSFYKPPVDVNFPYKIAVYDNLKVTFQFQLSFNNERFFIGLGLHTVKGNFILKPSKLASFKASSSNNLTLTLWKTSVTTVWVDVKPITNQTKPLSTLGAVNEMQNFFITSFTGSTLSDRYVQIETSQKISLTNGVISGFAFKMNDELINGDAIELYARNESCAISTNCQLCVTNIGCVWNKQKSICSNRSDAILDQNSKSLVLNPEMCYQCSHSINCSDCLKHGECLWLLTEQLCIRRNTILQNQITSKDKCPTSCFSRTSCTSCIDTSDDCVWCKTTGTCFPFHLYQALFLFGRCRDWVNGVTNDVTKVLNATKKCGACSVKDSCGDCLQTFGCGSCALIDDHKTDICLPGDFANAKSCDQISNGKAWNYTSCSGLDECASHSSLCHEKADCINTDYGYTCKCKLGYDGDGVNTCDKTCDQVCVHGKCSSFPDYFCACDLGWTGSNCSIDCSCNGHSWCNNGVGHCDKCYNNTAGPNCGICSPGSFGNASSPLGCQLCNCNGHGNVSLGVCDSETGTCFCTNDTEGPHCEFCQHNYFGDARLNGVCYAKCFGRTLITNIVQTGGIAMSENLNENENIFCVWILTTGSNIEVDPSAKAIVPLELTFESVNMDCFLDGFVIYEGIPNYILKTDSTTLSEQVVGRSCSFGQMKNSSTYFSKNGLMTVVYNGRGTIKNVAKFTAQYSPVSCPYSCKGRRECVKDICQCQSGYYGSMCEFQCGNECPNGCVFSIKSKSCICNEVSECSHKMIGSFLNMSEKLLLLSMKIFELRSSSMVADEKTNAIYIFGGYDSKTQSATNILIKINLSDGAVNEITTNISPNATFLYSYAVDVSQNGFFIYGGYGSNGGFYFFNFLTLQWSQLSTNVDQTNQKLPSLFGHTITMTSRSLIIIGGYSLESAFNYDIFFCNTETKIWRRLKPTGLSLPAIYAHTSTYYESTMSIYVYGGYIFDGTKMVLSNRLFVFNVVKQVWSMVANRKTNPSFFQPNSVSFAVSRIVNDYLVILHHVENFALVDFPKVQIFNIRDHLWNYVHFDKYNFSSIVLSKTATMKSVRFDWKISTPFGRNDILLLDTSVWKLYNFTFPNDYCLLIQNCSTQSCAFCRISESFDICFNKNSADTLSCILITNPQAQMTNKSQPDNECLLRKTCSECISDIDSPKCQWCSEPCTGGMCYSLGQSCDFYSPTCSLAQTHQILKLENCPENTCLRSDCESCINAGNKYDYECAFSKHVSKINAVYFNVTQQPKFPWSCTEYDKNYMSSLNWTVLNTGRCPKQCSSYNSCQLCAQANAENSRAESCLWLESFNQCISAFAVPLLCSNGYCGQITANQCSPSCESAKSCKECFQQKDCVWCASVPTDGDGFCKTDTKNNGSVNCKIQDNQKLTADEYQLHTYECPAENECLNGHNDCDADSEFCVDLPSGFNCVCKPGYERKLNKCVPVCVNGCVHGFCIKPDVCQCDFGFTAATCNVACNCNGHSNCPGPDDISTCLHCYNNTMGSQCELCQPSFIPVNKQCLTCVEYCNFHSKVCSSAGDIFTTNAFNTTNNFIQTSSDNNLICQECRNQTKGARCNQCLDGYFRPAYLPKTARCIPCLCNGHGVNNYCDPESGTNCTCTNNTFTPSCIGDNCWSFQCSKCKEYFRGSPVDGQQCFREVADGAENYCLTTGESGHCIEETFLEYYQPAFYVIFPDFSNVDVRIIIDITSGSAEVFLAIEDIFVVRKNELGLNVVSFNENKFGPNADVLRKLQENPNAQMNWRYLISAQQVSSTLNSFIQYSANPRVLWLQNLTNRATIIASTSDFDLQKTQFYLIVQSKSPKTIGNVVYIQDQARFELFIFLTVFCSCFVLFISLFVLLWQLKLSRGNNRARDNETIEIQQLSNRPFSRFSLFFEGICGDGEEKEKDDSLPNQKCTPCCLQFLRDNRSAVGTVLIRLPGGKRAPVQLCLASALLLEQNEEVKESENVVNVQNVNETKSSRRIFSLTSRNRIRPMTVQP